MRLSVLEKQILIEIPTRSDDASPVHFLWKIRSYYFLRNPSNIIKFFKDLCRFHFRIFEDIKELEIIFSCDDAPVIGSYDWFLGLSYFLVLKTISFKMSGRSRSHVEAHQKVIHGLIQMNFICDIPPMTCACPSLQTITLDGFMFGKIQFEEFSSNEVIVQALSKRKADNHPLKELYISNADALMRSTVTELQKVVDKIYLDGIELHAGAENLPYLVDDEVIYTFDDEEPFMFLVHETQTDNMSLLQEKGSM